MFNCTLFPLRAGFVFLVGTIAWRSQILWPVNKKTPYFDNQKRGVAVFNIMPQLEVEKILFMF